MKFILNKILFIFSLICFAPLLFSEAINYSDSVNIRKAFFLNESNWDKYNKNSANIFNEDKRIGMILKTDKDNYEIRFYTLNADKKNIYSFARLDYQLNKKKELQKVMFFYQNNEDSFLFFDRNNPGKFSIFLFGKIFKKNLEYNFAFDDLKTISINRLLDLLINLNLSKDLLIDFTDKNIKDKFISKVILPVSKYKYINDGGRNEIGKFVYIATEKEQKPNEQGVNCSGHAKEIVDSYIRFIKPDFTFLKISDLKIKREEERKSDAYTYYDLKFDTLFGIDWGKNLIDKINKICEYKLDPARELNNDEFATFFSSKGYEVKNIKNILFNDQIKNNNYFYLLVLNRNRKENPAIPEFAHIATIVSYFNDNNYYIRVFESGIETSLNNLFKNYGEGKVRIFKIPLPVSKL